jgi:vancomycin permeability regulator SanA
MHTDPVKSIKVKNTFRKCLLALGVCAAAGLTGVAAINLYVIRNSERYIVRNAVAPPRAAAVLVPGAAVWRGGRLSHILEDRAVTALYLYRKGAVKKILVSGDHGTRRYDEVNALKKYFLERGVRPADLFLDHAGFDTYSSMARASRVFAARDLVVVTQEFHLHRALYLARRSGLEARGVPADRRPYVNAARYRVREYFARVKAFANVLSRREPRFLGRTIPITGDGRASWD